MLDNKCPRNVIAALACLGTLLPACHGPHDCPEPDVDVDVRNLSRSGRFYIAGTPSERGLEQLRAQGVKHVIDLRGPEEGTSAEASSARHLGLNYVNIPMRPDTFSEDQAKKFLAAMDAARDEPVLIHCARGSRAGGMYGLYLGASGRCTTQQALEKARAAGLRNKLLEAAVEDYLRKHD